LEHGDIQSAARFREVLERHRPCALMHFAAYAYVEESMRDPMRYYQNNVAGTADMLRALIEFGPIPVVFSSSCATYGVPLTIPMSENQPQQPINPYGWSKLFTERMLMDSATYGLRSVSLRYFNAAGADSEGDTGEAHSPETHLIPLVLRAAQEGTAVCVFGNDYETADGSCVRDYVHVTDIADAHVHAFALSAGRWCKRRSQSGEQQRLFSARSGEYG
jgi:UDP-glucose-4-epimerase GalE